MKEFSLEAIDDEVDALISTLEYQLDILEEDEVFNPFETELIVRLNSLREARRKVRQFHSNL